MVSYSVKQLAKLAGVSIRTLHLYDEIGLLKPSARTTAGYRVYGEKELMRLQQILFYKELDFPLQEIRDILDDPGFDVLTALSDHKAALLLRRDRVSALIVTIDKTINQLKKGNKMLKPEELYEGLPKETGEAYRKEAIEKYGKAAVQRSEDHLRKMSKKEISFLKSQQTEIMVRLASMVGQNYSGAEVQKEIARHYEITRKFWGTDGLEDPQSKAYSGLGELYVSDERFTMMDGKPRPEFARFLCKAMQYFADSRLSRE